MTETSKAYASALFDLAMDSRMESETQDALHLLCDTILHTPGALDMLASPAIPRKERLAAIDEAWAGSLPEHVMGFLQVLTIHGHVRELADCVAAFDELIDIAHRLTTAKVVSAVPLTDEEQNRLREQLEKRLGRTVRLECTVDASILGGLIVTADGKVMDGSLKHRLHEIKDVMNG